MQAGGHLSRHLKFLTLLFISGLFLGDAFSFDYSTSIILLQLFALLTLLAFLSYRSFFPHTVILLFFPLGLLLHDGYPHSHDIIRYADGSKQRIEGLVIGREDDGEKKRFVVHAEKIIDENIEVETAGRITLTIRKGGDNVVPGSRIRFWAKLKRPRNFGNAGGFDYDGFLKKKGIYVSSFMSDDTYLAIMGKVPPFWSFIYKFRYAVEGAIDDAPPHEDSPGEGRGIIKAITIGEKGDLGEDVLESFRRSGTAHLLAISGLHMGIVAFFFFRIFRWLLARWERLLIYNLAGKGAALLTIFPLSLYLFASGMATSALRAYIMVMVFLMSILVEREGEIFNTIAAAAMIILAAWPQALFDIAFQLSFSAVIAIVYLAPRMESLMKMATGDKIHPPFNKVITFIVVSLSASIGTAPIVSHYFMEISLVSVLTNIILVPLIGFLAVPVSGLALFASLLSPLLSKPLFAIALYIADLSLPVASYMSHLPYSSILISPPSPGEIFLFYALLIALFSMKKRVVVPALAVIPVVFVFGGHYEFTGHEKAAPLEVSFLSVGQGESTFIKFPLGMTMLVDGGGFYDNSFDVGKMVVRPYLLTRGIKRLDYVVLTHPHPDHMNGLMHILDRFDIGEVWLPNVETDDDDYARLKSIIRARHIPVRYEDSIKGDNIIDGVLVKLFKRERRDWESGYSDSSVNNGSLVIKLIYGGKSFLLAADIEKEEEARILDAGFNLKATVLKVPHHGSLTSSTSHFVEKVSPDYAVMTVGYENRFHFPRDDVVKRYKMVNSKILRTDLSGTVTFETDGRNMTLTTFRDTAKGEAFPD